MEEKVKPRSNAKIKSVTLEISDGRSKGVFKFVMPARALHEFEIKSGLYPSDDYCTLKDVMDRMTINHLILIVNLQDRIFHLQNRKWWEMKWW